MAEYNGQTRIYRPPTATSANFIPSWWWKIGGVWQTRHIQRFQDTCRSFPSGADTKEEVGFPFFLLGKVLQLCNTKWDMMR